VPQLYKKKKEHCANVIYTLSAGEAREISMMGGDPRSSIVVWGGGGEGWPILLRNPKRFEKKTKNVLFKVRESISLPRKRGGRKHPLTRGEKERRRNRVFLRQRGKGGTFLRGGEGERRLRREGNTKIFLRETRGGKKEGAFKL